MTLTTQFDASYMQLYDQANGFSGRQNRNTWSTNLFSERYRIRIQSIPLNPATATLPQSCARIATVRTLVE
jgi:hypothetical protein